MPSPTPPAQKMGELHEIYLAKVNAGRKSKASGSQWTDPADGRNAHDEPLCLAWDGKSTLGKQIAVTLEMVRKIREQALGEIPQIGLRWYANASLKDVLEDWVAVPGSDWENILRCARAWVEVESCVGGMTPDNVREYLEEWVKARTDNQVMAEGIQAMRKGHEEDLATVRSLTGALDQARRDLLEAGERLAAQQLELDALRAQARGPVFAAGMLQPPRIPWTVVRLFSQAEKDRRKARQEPEGAGEATGYAADGTIRETLARIVRVERSPGNRPKLFVDGVQARYADVYQPDGKILVRVCHDDPSAEVG